MLKGYLFVISSAILFGCMPLGAKIIYANGVNAVSLVFYRNILAVPVLLLILKAKKEDIKISVRELAKLVILAVLGNVLTPMLLYSSYNYISSGTSTALHFVYPAVVILLEMLFFKEKISRRAFLCVWLCLVGISMFYTPDGAINLVGVILAIASGATYAVYIVFLSHFDLGNISGMKYSFYMSCICSLIMLTVSVPAGKFTVPSNFMCWCVCVAFSIVLSVGAVVLFRQGTLMVGGQRSAILSTFEPVTSLLVGIVVFKECLSAGSAAGSILILFAAVLIAGK